MNSQKPATFAALFKKYRLRSEFESLSDFGDALSQRSLRYEDSIFSHWQKGSRVPRDRNLLLIILKVFVQKGGITNLKEANSLLTAANQGYLSDEELQQFPQFTSANAPFQAPREIQSFTGRESYLHHVKNHLLNGEPVLIYGPAGMGKTSAAIKLAHRMRDEFPDGVLWHRLDTSKPEDVLSAIAYTFGHRINEMKDIYSKASFVRSLLAPKKILLVFDNLEHDYPLELLLPNSSANGVLVTSRYEDVGDSFSLTKHPLIEFNEKESTLLFQLILGKPYVKKHADQLNAISAYVGHLPLALNILAKQLMRTRQQPNELLQELKNNELKLEKLIYEDKNLLSTLELAYSKLSELQQRVFSTLGIFEGTDFSLEAVAYINDLTPKETQNVLDELISASLVEHSIGKRYRLHPVVKLFAQSKIKEPKIYQKAANYYRQFIKRTRLNLNFYILLRPEIANVTYLFIKCCQLDYFDSVGIIWRELVHYLWDTGEWAQVEEIAKLTYRLAAKHKDLYIKAICCIEAFNWVYYWTGRINKAEQYIKEALKIAYEQKDEFLTAYAKQLLGRTLRGKQQFGESMKNLEESLRYFEKEKNYRRAGNNYRYMAETSSLMGNYALAKKYLYKGLACLDKVKHRFATIEIYQNLIDTHLGALLLLEESSKQNEINMREDLEIEKKVNTHLGAHLLLKNSNEQAKLYFKESLEIDKKVGSKSTGQIWNNIGLGLVYERSNDKLKAQLHFAKAKEMLLFFDLGKEIEYRHIFLFILKNELKKSKFYPYLNKLI